MKRLRIQLVLTIIMGCLETHLAFSQDLSNIETDIIRRIEANNKEALSLLEKVVNMNSGTMNLAGVKKVGEVFGNEFRAIGLSTRWSEMPEAMNRGGHLIAETKGSKGQGLLLIGHLDTVFEENSLFQEFDNLDSIALGPGAADMKGGNVIMLYALRALHETGALADRRIIAVLHGDEEETGKPLDISRKDIIEAAQKSDVALGFEGAGGFGQAVVARRGSSGWKLEVTGNRAHSSGIFNPNVGAGAIFETSRILFKFYERLSYEQYLTFNPGVIVGGTLVEYDDNAFEGKAFGKSNVTPQKVVVTGGLRFITEEQKELARHSMRKIVSESLPKTQAEITFWDSYPAMPPTEGNQKILQVLNQVSLDLGYGKVDAFDPGGRGAADISFVAEYLDGVDGLGAMGRGAHSPEEYVDLRTFEALTKRAAILIYRLTKD